MKKFHIAIGVADIDASIHDYSRRIGWSPEVVIPNEYALWRTDTLNFSIRRVSRSESGRLRHLGWEDASRTSFVTETDVNGILWEHFSPEQQVEEIESTWPNASHKS